MCVCLTSCTKQVQFPFGVRRSSWILEPVIAHIKYKFFVQFLSCLWVNVKYKFFSCKHHSVYVRA